MIWFTADEHYGHANIIKFCARPFISVEEMNETLITNHNAVVAKTDTVYHLGDFSYKCNPPLARRIFLNLNGTHHLIRGGHDKQPASLGFSTISPLSRIEVEGITVVLCHWAMRVWDKSHYGSWHLYGHSHGHLPPHGLSFDVGVDSWSYYPLSWEGVKTQMKELQDAQNTTQPSNLS